MSDAFIWPPCPACNMPHGLNKPGQPIPVPGTIAICVQCAAISEYSEIPGGLALRLVTKEDVEAFDPEFQIKLLISVSAIKERIRLGLHHQRFT